MIYFNRRIFKWFCGCAILLVLILSVTHLPVFPCLEFVADSDQGYFLTLCPLVNDDGLFIFSTPGYYDPITFVWTWVGGAIILFGIPYVAAVLMNRRLEKNKFHKV